MNQTRIRLGLIAFSILASAAVSATGQTRDANGYDRHAQPNRYDAEPLALNYADDEPVTSEDVATETSTNTYQETTSEPEPILWKGFLYGDQHFKKKPRPIGSPLYFEDPFINSDLRLIYLYHKFPGDICASRRRPERLCPPDTPRPY